MRQHPRGQQVEPADEHELLLLSTGATGADGGASAEWFLSPLPPPGDLRVHCAWPSGGIPETTTSISAAELLAAAGRVQQLWPSARAFDRQP